MKARRKVLRFGATLTDMPRKRPRVTVTESPDLARRLDLAATRFPERSHSRADLLLALTEVAEQALVHGPGRDEKREHAKHRLLQRTRSLTTEEADAMLAARDLDWQQEF